MPKNQIPLTEKEQLQHDLDSFDFSPLWQTEEVGGFGKIIPWIQLILTLIVFITLLIK